MAKHDSIVESLKTNKNLVTPLNDIRENIRSSDVKTAIKKRCTHALNRISHPNYKLTTSNYIAVVGELLFYTEQALLNFPKFGKTDLDRVKAICTASNIELGALADTPLAQTYFSEFSKPYKPLERASYQTEVLAFFEKNIISPSKKLNDDLGITTSTSLLKELSIEFNYRSLCTLKGAQKDNKIKETDVDQAIESAVQNVIAKQLISNEQNPLNPDLFSFSYEFDQSTSKVKLKVSLKDSYAESLVKDPQKEETLSSSIAKDVVNTLNALIKNTL